WARPPKRRLVLLDQFSQLANARLAARRRNKALRMVGEIKRPSLAVRIAAQEPQATVAGTVMRITAAAQAGCRVGQRNRTQAGRPLQHLADPDVGLPRSRLPFTEDD